MVKIIDFIKEEKLKFTYVNTFYDKTRGKKGYSGLLPKWEQKTYEELLIEYENAIKEIESNKKLSFNERKQKGLKPCQCGRNQFMIRMNRSKYLVIDIDTEEIHEPFVEFLKSHDIYNSKAITKSYSGKEHYYKRHYWFRVFEKDFAEFGKFKNSCIQLPQGIDIFYGSDCQISEWDDAELVINENDTDVMPYLSGKIFYKMMQDLELDENLIFEKEQKIKKKVKKDKFIKNDTDSETDSETESKTENDAESDAESDVENDAEDGKYSTLKEALFALDIKRADNYCYWFPIACIFKNEKIPLDLFYKFSSRSTKYNKDSVTDFLNKLKPKSGYTIATIYKYLKEDNFEIFQKLNSKRKDIYKILEQMTDNDFSKIFFNLKPDDYVYSSTSESWYSYNDNNIIMCYGKNAPTDIYCNISNTLSSYIEEQKNMLELKNKNFKKYSTILKKAYTKINKSAFPKSMLPYLQNLYRDDGIEDKFDKNTNLIAFKNGVYDVELGSFRAIKREDYITKGISYEYPTKSNKDMRKYILKILGDIFDEDDLEYYLKTTGLSLFTNKFENVYVHSGASGRNGKSLLGECLTQTFEHLVYSVQPEFFNSNTKTGQANQELAELKNARIMLCSEPDSSTESKIKNSLFKRITGNDIISARANFSKKQLQYKPNFTIHMFCNDIPEFSKMEKAIERRLKIIKYKYQFVEKPKNEYQKLVDTSLKDKVRSQDFKNEFALLLFEYATKFIKCNIIEMPESIKESTNEYFDSNNILKEWLETYYKYEYNSKKPHKIKCSYMKKEYLEDMDIEFIDDKKFIGYLKFNEVELKIIQKVNCALHYVRKTDKEISDYKKSLTEEIIKGNGAINNSNSDSDSDSDEMSTGFELDLY